MKDSRVVLALSLSLGLAFGIGLVAFLVEVGEMNALTDSPPTAVENKGGKTPPEFIDAARDAIAKTEIEAEEAQLEPKPIEDEKLAGEESAEVIDVGDSRVYQIGDTDVQRRRPRTFRMPRPGTMTCETLRDQLERTFTADNAMNENLKSEAVVAQLRKQEEAVFTGEKMIYFLVDFPVSERPTDEQVLAKMREMGGEPANALDLMIFVKKVVGSARFRIRINEIGSAGIMLDNGVAHRAYAYWQKDRLVYQAKDPASWRPTWAFQLVQEEVAIGQGGWNFDKGWVMPNDPKDWFLAKRPVPPKEK